MKFLSNIYNPRKPDAKMYFTTSFEANFDVRKRDEEWDRYMEWVNRNVICRPMATDTYTVEQLEGMGMVGIYEKLPKEIEYPKNLGKQ